MRFTPFVLISILSLAHAELQTCTDPLYLLLQQKQSSQSTTLLNLLDNYELKQFRENTQNWSSSTKQLCKENDCECLIDLYQQRNLELSQKIKKITAESQTKIIQFTGQDTECGFDKTFPKNMKVFAAGSYSGMHSDYRIGEKGENASVFRIIVNSPHEPVALILGAYDPSIWDISWSEGTKIEAVFTMGYHEQAISGLSKSVPVIIRNMRCNNFYINEENLNQINPLSNKLFKKNADSVYYAKDGYIFIGDSISDQEMLFNSADTSIASLNHQDAPLQKDEALYDAVSKGILRTVTPEDINRWLENLPKNQNLPKVATPSPNKSKPYVHKGFVILKPFSIPEGLYGGYSATFFLEKGVPIPTGDLGHSSLYDFNTMTCKGVTCNINFTGF
jgi:hypothetical protein